MFNRKHSYRFDGTDITFTATSREVAAFNYIYDLYKSLTRYGVRSDVYADVAEFWCPDKLKIARRLIGRIMKTHDLHSLGNDEFSTQIIPTF